MLLFALLSPEEVPKPTQKATIVELLEEPELPRRPSQPPLDMKQFVRSAPAPEDLLTDEKKEARFSSETEQNVRLESQARASGMTANRSSQGGEEKTTAPRAGRQDGRKKLDFTPDSPVEKFAENELSNSGGDIPVGGLNPSRQRSGIPSSDGKSLDFSKFGSVERGMSTVGEALPEDIKFGDFTALNTDRHLYYSFYSRIEEKIRNRWVNYARAVVFGVENGNEQAPSNATWTTKLEVILDPKGNFMKAILHESSGLHSLDSAPVQAFREAHQFPNPPPEMIKEDGTIRIHYAFSVNLVPRYAGGE